MLHSYAGARAWALQQEIGSGGKGRALCKRGILSEIARSLLIMLRTPPVPQKVVIQTGKVLGNLRVGLCDGVLFQIGAC